MFSTLRNFCTPYLHTFSNRGNILEEKIPFLSTFYGFIALFLLYAEFKETFYYFFMYFSNIIIMKEMKIFSNFCSNEKMEVMRFCRKIFPGVIKYF